MSLRSMLGTPIVGKQKPGEAFYDPAARQALRLSRRVKSGDPKLSNKANAMSWRSTAPEALGMEPKVGMPKKQKSPISPFKRILGLKGVR